MEIDSVRFEKDGRVAVTYRNTEGDRMELLLDSGDLDSFNAFEDELLDLVEAAQA